MTVIREDSVSLTDYIGTDKVISDLVENMTDLERDGINKAVASIKVSAKK